MAQPSHSREGCKLVPAQGQVRQLIETGSVVSCMLTQGLGSSGEEVSAAPNVSRAGRDLGGLLVCVPGPASAQWASCLRVCTHRLVGIC